MIRQVFSDGSVGHIFEVGDKVVVTKDDGYHNGWVRYHKGEEGEVIKTNDPPNCISRPRVFWGNDHFFCSTKIPTWDLGPSKHHKKKIKEVIIKD